jgi:hypothetical protein
MFLLSAIGAVVLVCIAIYLLAVAGLYVAWKMGLLESPQDLDQ